jgi:hypothetical protein
MSETTETAAIGPPGFVKAILGKAWMHHEVGAAVWVDPERKEWLDKNGYLTVTTVATVTTGQNATITPAKQKEVAPRG